MYAYSYIKSAVEAISGYTGSQPFALYLRQFFSRNKKFGARDRKAISHLCYCHFRLGHALPELSPTDKMTAGLFLCSGQKEAMLLELSPLFHEKVQLLPDEKMQLAGDGHLWEKIFPLLNHLSPSIEKKEFALAHLMQPALFLRIRPGYEKEVQKKIIEAELPAIFLSPNTLQLPVGANLASVFEMNKEVVVQDYSSQQTGHLFNKFIPLLPTGKKFQVLDACAASGGKTIMLYDELGEKANYTVSDIRLSILHNLEKRLKEAGIKNVRSVQADISIENAFGKAGEQFDIIIADVPCSGSGTWRRCPENLVFFTEIQLQEYTALQQNIVKNLVPLLKPGGLLFYITCSVYAVENERQTEYLQQECGLQLLQKQYFTGYEQQADTMYGAVLQQLLPV
jgi:16S rRNA (cytosine967-C5)-methyltransferase